MGSGFAKTILMPNLVILCLVYIVAPIAIKALSGTVNIYFIVFELIGAVYKMVGVCFWALLILFLHKLLRTRIRSKITWDILLLPPVIFIGSVSLYRCLPSVRAQQILTDADLAPLPESATEIRVFTWSTPFSGQDFLKFHANQDDIERFLKTSPVLKNAECQQYSKDKMRLIYPKDYWQNKKKYDQDGHEYIWHDPRTPAWYMEEIKGPATRYRLHPERYHSYAELIVDEENNLILVNLVFS